MLEKRKKILRPLLGEVLKKIAPRLQAQIIMEPEWNIAGQIVFQNGRKRYFRYSSLDLNSLGASEIAKDKDYANFFMKKMGYSIVPGSRTFYSNEWAKVIGQPERGITNAYCYAKKMGWPVIVKPNSGSQGVGVALARDKTEFYRAIRAALKNDRVALVQRPVSGKDYRLVVLDNQVISAYERRPLSILGDGRQTIKQLISLKSKEFMKASRDTQLNIKDPRITEKLKSVNKNFQSIPEKGERVFLLDNANLSTGGEAFDVTNKIHPAFRKLAIQLTKDMGLRFCGVDLMVQGDICEKPDKYWILEVNAAPGLDHYAETGLAQKKIVEDLYLKVLKSLNR